MSAPRGIRSACLRAWPTVLLLAATTPPLFAEQLPLRTYRVSDGLAPGQVRVVHQDRKGFVWVGTGDGLSRFDGSRFVNYGLADGLPHVAVTSIAEDTLGRLWVGTFGGGLARLQDEAGQEAFRAVASEPGQVLALSVDDDGAVYWVSSVGLHRGRETPSGWRTELIYPAALLFERHKPLFCPQAVRDGQGRTWFGVADHFVSVARGEVVEHPPPSGEAGHPVLGLTVAGNRMVAVYGSTTFERPLAVGGSQSWIPRSTAPQGALFTGAVVGTAEGRLFLGTTRSLLRQQGTETREFTQVLGRFVLALATDREGGVWIGADTTLSRLPRDVTFVLTAADGLDSLRRVVACANGRVFAGTEGGLFEVTEGRGSPREGLGCRGPAPR